MRARKGGNLPPSRGVLSVRFPSVPVPMTPRHLLPFLLVALFALAGCDTGEASDGPTCTSTSSGFLTADVDGQPFEAECLSATVQGGTLVVFGSTVTDTPEGRIQRRIDLIVAEVALGTFAVGSTAQASYRVTNLDDADSPTNRVYNGESGEVVVTEYRQENPMGRFSFTGRDGEETVTVTDGLFDIFE